MKEREKKYGDFDVIDQDHRLSHLHVIDVTTKATRRLTSGAFTVGRFSWSPDSTRFAFDHRINGDPANGGSANISIVTAADARITPLVTQEGPDANPAWSPDGTRIAFTSFDEDASIVRWTTKGIMFSASARTWSYLYSLDPSTRAVTKVAPADKWIGSGFSLSADGTTAAFLRARSSSSRTTAAAPDTARSSAP